MQQHTSATDNGKSPVGKMNDELAAGQTEEAKPVTVIPWFFMALGVIAVVVMVIFLITNRH